MRTLSAEFAAKIAAQNATIEKITAERAAALDAAADGDSAAVKRLRGLTADLGDAQDLLGALEKRRTEAFAAEAADAQRAREETFKAASSAALKKGAVSMKAVEKSFNALADALEGLRSARSELWTALGAVGAPARDRDLLPGYGDMSLEAYLEVVKPGRARELAVQAGRALKAVEDPEIVGYLLDRVLEDIAAEAEYRTHPRVAFYAEPGPGQTAPAVGAPEVQA